MKRPAAACSSSVVRKKPSARQPLGCSANEDAQTKKRPSAEELSCDEIGIAVGPPVAQVFVAMQRTLARSRKPVLHLLGAYGDPEDAISCAAAAEEVYAWKPGDKVCLDLYEYQASFGRMRCCNVTGTVQERKLENLEHIVKYVIDIKPDKGLGPAGAPLKTRLPKTKDPFDEGQKELRKGIVGTTTRIEAPREYLSRDYMEATEDNCMADASSKDQSEAEEDEEEHASSLESEEDEGLYADGLGLEFIVQRHDLDSNVDNCNLWVAHIAANRCHPGEVRVCSSIQAANTYACARFAQRLREFRKELQSRKTTSGAKKVSANDLLGAPGCFLKAPAKHCFAQTERDGFFLAGICDYLEDDFSDLESDEEIDFLGQAYQEFHWITHLTQNEASPLPAPALPSEHRRSSKLRKKKGTRKAISSGEDVQIYSAVRTSREVEEPAQNVLGLYSDAVFARQRLADAEKVEAYKNGTKVRFNIYEKHYGSDLKGTIHDREEDLQSNYAVKYIVKLDFDATAKKLFGAPGLPLPTELADPQRHIKKPSRMRLKKGVEGTTDFLKLPRSLLEMEDHDFWNDLPTYAVAPVVVSNKVAAPSPAQNLLTRMLRLSKLGIPGLPDRLQNLVHKFACQTVWVSFYEPSTTGWGDECRFQVFTTAAAANLHAGRAFKHRIRGLREICSPQPKCLQPQDEPGGFCRVPAKALMLANFPASRGFKNIVKKKQKCYAKTKHNGLFVAAVSNYHGDHLDGCGNPYMAEWWWVEERLINLPCHFDAKKSGRKRGSRPDGDGDCNIS